VNLFTSGPDGKRARAWRVPVESGLPLKPYGVRTTTAPFIPAWRVQRYEKRPALLNVRAAEPLFRSGIFPPAGAVPSNVTLCVSGPGNVQVTLPFTAIFTVSGLKVDPAPLAVTSAVVLSALTVAFVVAVNVLPPEVSDA
jgi:hypothetical protein